MSDGFFMNDLQSQTLLIRTAVDRSCKFLIIPSICRGSWVKEVDIDPEMLKVYTE